MPTAITEAGGSSSSGVAGKFCEKLSSVIRGFHIAEKLVSEDLTTHFLVMNQPVGDCMHMLKDVVLMKMFYSGEEPYYKEKEYGKLFRKPWLMKKLAVITDEDHAGIARLFTSVDYVTVLTREELADIGSYAGALLCVHTNLHGDVYASPSDGSEERIKQLLFKVPGYRWMMEFPMDFPAAEEWALSSMKVSKKSLQNALEQMKDYGIPPCWRVVICPYSKSSSILPLGEWMAFIAHCKRNGFFVYTYIGTEGEESLPDTSSLQVSVDVLAAMGQLGCIIVGVQNGIIDLFRSMNNDTRVFSISCLYTPYDRMLAAERGLRQKVERRKNTVHLLLEKEDDAMELIIEQFYQFMAGSIQRECFSHMDKRNLLLYSRKNLNEYAKELAGMKHVIIFLAVYDSADKYWNLFEKEILGLKCDLSWEWRKSYIAVVDREEQFVHEEMRRDCLEVIYQSSFAENQYYLSSHAMGKGHYTKCAIAVNGQQYALNKRGLNIVVFDKGKNTVIDSIWVDIWADRNLSVRR